MRIPALAAALVLFLSATPFAAANEAPHAIASVQADAVLDEPVTFTSLSYDADGSIASTTWEFSSDGRQVNGASVTYAFSFPAVHTITLRVTDDDGATSFLEIQLVVRAPLMQGRAYAVRTWDDTYGDSGDVSTTAHSDNADALGDVRYGQLRVAGLDATLRTLEHRAVARATVGSVYIPVPIGYILVTGVESESIVGCDYPTLRHARFTQVRLNDAPIVPPGEVPPNTRIALPGVGLLELNVQEAPAPDRLSSIALRLTLPDGGVIEIGHAEAGVSHCPWP